MIGSSLLLTLEFYQYNICKRNKYLLHGEWSTAVGLVYLVPISGFFYKNHLFLNHCLGPFITPPKKGAIRHYLCGTTELLPYAQGWSMLPIMVRFEFIVYSFQQRAIIQQHLTQIMYLGSNGNTTQRTLRPREIVGDVNNLFQPSCKRGFFPVTDIHGRMPVILRQQDEQNWLDRNVLILNDCGHCWCHMMPVRCERVRHQQARNLMSLGAWRAIRFFPSPSRQQIGRPECPAFQTHRLPGTHIFYKVPAHPY